MIRQIGLGLSGVGILVFGLGLSYIMGCGNARAIAARGDGDARFRSCYAIGFSRQDVAALYDSAIIDRANGFSYYEESRTAANACVSSCNYEAACSNGCTSCAYEVIDAAYFKSLEELPTKGSMEKDSIFSLTIKNLFQ